MDDGSFLRRLDNYPDSGCSLPPIKIPGPGTGSRVPFCKDGMIDIPRHRRTSSPTLFAILNPFGPRYSVRSVENVLIV